MANGGVVEMMQYGGYVLALAAQRNEVPALATVKEQDSRLEPPRLPLATRGSRIIDRLGYLVRLRCVNWYGAHMHELVVGGLHKQPLSSLVRSIHVLGFNCVRLPYSLEMHLRRPDARPRDAALLANPELQNMTALAIFDATVKALVDARIMVVLNNHQGKAMWCCSEDDGEGLWYSQEYSEEDWLQSLRLLARRYREEPYVVGFDLRNELRGIPAPVAWSLGLYPQGYRFWPQWGLSGGGKGDWGDAALRAGAAVLQEKSDALIVVEGLDFSTDLRGVRQRPLHREPLLRGRVVYEAHDYCWYHVNFFRAWLLYWLSLGWAAEVFWIAKVTAEPLELVAKLRRVALAAGHGGPPELRCGLRLMCGTEVQQVGRDRLLAFPARPAWRRYLRSDGEFSDFIGPYEIKRFEPSDIWLIGAYEPIALEGSVQISSGYISARRLPLPLPEGHSIHAFKLENGCATVLMARGLSGEAMEGLKDGRLQKFRLYGLEEEDLRAVRFQAEGDPVPFKFKFPAVFQGHDPRGEGYYPVLDNFDWKEGDQSEGARGKRLERGPSLPDGIIGRNLCGRLLARDCVQQDGLNIERGYNFEVSEVQEGGALQRLATWKVVGHIIHQCQALGDRLLLMAGERSGEDAFYESMQLVEWPTQSKVREVPLKFEPSYIESEWPRGILSGSTQTFFTCHEKNAFSEWVFVFATPET
ncbi:unnamed protein product [Symbiodinium sp. CCMP2592]|nr:unnamed protein product [Symbiodinium sp. CCMP2592]